VLTGEIRNKIDKIWSDIWAGGISNPLTVIEQLTYLMFIRSLDEKQLENESFEALSGEVMPKIFPQDEDGQAMRWSKLKQKIPESYMILSARRCSHLLKH
jgi:type I restriction enzyme M protein